MPLFKHWTRSQIAQLLLQTEEVAYPRNHRVFKEGDLPDKMYFIMQGEIEVSECYIFVQSIHCLLFKKINYLRSCGGELN